MGRSQMSSEKQQAGDVFFQQISAVVENTPPPPTTKPSFFHSGSYCTFTTFLPNHESEIIPREGESSPTQQEWRGVASAVIPCYWEAIFRENPFKQKNA